VKHKLNVTLLLLGMFFITQFIGLAVIYSYNTPIEQTFFNETTQQYEVVNTPPELPYGMQPPEMQPEASLLSILFSIVMATVIILLIRKFKLPVLLRWWFFAVVVLALGITFNALLSKFFIGPVQLLALFIALPLAFYKVFRRNMIVHNLTELLIYPGITAVFVPILTVWTTIVLLVLIAIYDVYAVWHAKFMQKMAKFQINELKVFTGFFLPYVAKKDRVKIEKIKSAKLTEKAKVSKLKKLRIKVNLAILGGGDVSFPLIFAGVLLKAYGWVPALIISVVSTIALALLFFLAKKGKFYPAMLFLSPACILGWLIWLPFR
jgi:presenilin-like A22 family membrane protease